MLREQDGKSIARGNWKSVLSRSMKDDRKRRFILKCVGRVLKYEVRQLCSDKCEYILLSQNVEDFNWSIVVQNAERMSPCLLYLIRQCLPYNDNGGTSNLRISGLIIAILLKQQRERASLFQKVLSLILFAGHCTKSVSYHSSMSIA